MWTAATGPCDVPLVLRLALDDAQPQVVVAAAAALLALLGPSPHEESIIALSDLCPLPGLSCWFSRPCTHVDGVEWLLGNGPGGERGCGRREGRGGGSGGGKGAGRDGGRGWEREDITIFSPPPLFTHAQSSQIVHVL